MDEFIRQAYADGMLNDNSHIAPDPIDYHPSLSSHDTTQPSTTTTATNRIPTPTEQEEELILLSDDDDDGYNNNSHSTHASIPPPPSTSTTSYDQTPYLSSPMPPPPPPRASPVIKVSLPNTYLSQIRQRTFPPHTPYEDFLIKGCFSSLVTNPRVIKNEFDLQAYLNDGSDCLLVRLASDLLAQRIGITVDKLMSKRRECKNDFDKQRFQADFNDRLKTFGHGMARLNAIMTVRIFSDDQLPMVIQIDES